MAGQRTALSRGNGPVTDKQPADPLSLGPRRTGCDPYCRKTLTFQEIHLSAIMPDWNKYAATASHTPVSSAYRWEIDQIKIYPHTYDPAFNV